MEPLRELDQVSRVLILIPTPQEMELLPLVDLQRWMQRDSEKTFAPTDAPVLVRRCGFGSVAAAARTVKLINDFKPDAVVLAGIAGTYGLPKIEEAGCFARVTMGDLGAGTGEVSTTRNAGDYPVQLPSQIQIPQWISEDQKSVIFESLPLCQAPEMSTWEELITVNVAAGNEQIAASRRERFPEAAAEDMEGFGVAFACAITQTPLTIIRGISNTVGDRRVSQWRMKEALANVDRLVTLWCQRRLTACRDDRNEVLRSKSDTKQA